MKENINALDEINKGSTMGIDAIHYIIEKVKDKKFKEILNKQYKDYENITKEINAIYDKYNNEEEPHETSVMNKVVTWYEVELKTLLDCNDSKIAELLIQGTNMGIIEGRRILNKKKISEEVHNIVSKYVTMQENIVEKLKCYL